MVGKKTIPYEVEVSVDYSDLKKMGQAFETAGREAKQAFTGLTGALAASNADINGLEDTLKGTTKAFLAVKKASGDAFEDDSIIAYVQQLNKLGAEFDEIEAEADQVAASLKRATDVNMGATLGGDAQRVSEGMRRVRQSTDEITDSAQKAKNASANMFGNAAQDLGAMVGLSGSAGVALGQLAEGAADAANGGEGMASVFKGLAGSAGPIVALSALTIGAAKALEAYGAKAKKTAEDTKAVADAILEQSDAVGALNEAFENLNQGAPLDAAQQFAQALAKTPEEFTKIAASAELLGISLGGLGPVFDAIEADSEGALTGLALSVIGSTHVIDEQMQTMAEIMAQSVDDFEGGAEAFQAFSARAAAIGIPQDVIDSYKDTVFALEAINDAQQNNDINEVARQQLVYAEALGKVNEVAQEALDLARQRAGVGATDFQVWNEYVAILNRVQAAFAGVAPLIEQDAELQDRMTESTELHNQALEDQTTAVADGIQAWKDHTAAVSEARIELDNILDTTTDVAAALETEFGKVNDVFEGLAFDVDFRPAMTDALDDLSSFRPDFQTLADEWEDILSGKDVKIFGNVRADDDEFLELTAKVRELFQGGIINEFEQGGVDAANTFAQSVAATIAESTGLSIQDVYKIMGLTPDGTVEAVIEPVVDAQHADQARAILDSLAGVEGDEAREARIHVALETEQIDGDVAYIASLLLAHEALGINVEPQLKDFTPAQIAQAQAVIDGSGTTVTVPVEPEMSDNWFDTLWSTPPDPVPVPVELTADNAGAVDKLIDAVADKRRLADINVKAPDAGKVDKILDAVADPGGAGRIAEIFAIVNAGTKQQAAATLDNVANPLLTAGRVANIKANPTNVGPADATLDGVAAPRSANISVRADNAGQVDRILDDVANPNGNPRYADIYVRTHNTVTTNIGGGAGPTPIPNLAPAGFAAGDEAVGVTPYAGSATVATFGTPVSVSTAVAPVVHNHVTISAAVIGSRFDVQRAVSKALRQAQRLNGVRV